MRAQPEWPPASWSVRGVCVCAPPHSGSVPTGIGGTWPACLVYVLAGMWPACLVYVLVGMWPAFLVWVLGGMWPA